MMFDPKTNRFPYPEDTDRHYLVVKKNRGITFDANYPYVDRSKRFLLKQDLLRVLLRVIVFPLCTIRLGLKIEGRENLKKHRDLLNKGVVSVSNHVHMWDYLAINKAIRPIRPNVLSWAPDINGEFGTLIRLTGGIPIPESGIPATKAYLKAVNRLLTEDHEWLQIYAEGSMWEFYAPIRPFKTGAIRIAIDCGKPVLPMAFSFRKPGWIRKNVFRQIAKITLRIGEPIFPDKSLPINERRKEMTVRCHNEVCRLAGIESDENLYPPLYDQSKRIDYYTTEYGVGYRGSH
jgi:1-acyl-sn-glycerol-3-phosphate acyltransferase